MSRRVRVAGDRFHGRVPAGAVYVGRSAPGLPASRYANRHPVLVVSDPAMARSSVGGCRACGGSHGGRASSVAAFARDLAADPALVAAARGELGGFDLACWCPLAARPCHADVLLLVVAGADPLDAYAVVMAAGPGGAVR